MCVCGFFFVKKKTYYLSRISMCFKSVACYLKNFASPPCLLLTHNNSSFDMPISTLASVIAVTSTTRKNVSIFVYYNLTKMLLQQSLQIFQICIPIDNCSILVYMALVQLTSSFVRRVANPAYTELDCPYVECPPVRRNLY